MVGDVGTGKTFAAGCIANALIDRGISVRFVSVSDAVYRMQEICISDRSGGDRENFIRALISPELLILDDLGAERKTSFGKERVFDIINRRVLTGKPMLITTNIPVAAMHDAADLEDRRIYDRVLQVCTPVLFWEDNFRRNIAAENRKKAAQYVE